MIEKIYASCSFGKDSIAAIIVAIEQMKLKIDKAVYVRIMFDENTSAELPEHEEFIHNKAIPELEKRYGLKTDIITSKKNYCEWFNTKRGKRSKHEGNIYGFPLILSNRGWCNSRLKVNVIKEYEKTNATTNKIVGIAYDEAKRAERFLKNHGGILPLYENKITEAMAMDICKQHKLLSPAYKRQNRLGCWFCQRQRLSSLETLHHYYPQLFQKLLALDDFSPTTFKPPYTVKALDAKFQQNIIARFGE